MKKLQTLLAAIVLVVSVSCSSDSSDPVTNDNNVIDDTAPFFYSDVTHQQEPFEANKFSSKYK